MEYSAESLNKEVEEFQNRVTQFKALLETLGKVEKEFSEIKIDFEEVNKKSKELIDFQETINKKYSEIKQHQSEEIVNVKDGLCKLIDDNHNSIHDFMKVKIDEIHKEHYEGMTTFTKLIDNNHNSIHDFMKVKIDEIHKEHYEGMTTFTKLIGSIESSFIMISDRYNEKLDENMSSIQSLHDKNTEMQNEILVQSKQIKNVIYIGGISIAFLITLIILALIL